MEFILLIVKYLVKFVNFGVFVFISRKKNNCNNEV